MKLSTTSNKQDIKDQLRSLSNRLDGARHLFFIIRDKAVKYNQYISGYRFIGDVADKRLYINLAEEIPNWGAGNQWLPKTEKNIKIIEDYNRANAKRNQYYRTANTIQHTIINLLLLLHPKTIARDWLSAGDLLIPDWKKKAGI